MSLAKREIEELLELIRLTKDGEINCDECLSRVAEFAERELAGKPMPERLDAVKHHLAICGECREEYEALQRVLEESRGIDRS